jgi:hypothetical protein
MASKSDDLVEQLRQNLELRRELGAEVAKARDSSAKQDGKMAGATATQHRPPELTTTEARQGTGPRAMFWVLIGSLTLAVIAGLALGLAFGWVPLPWNVTP